MSSALFSEFSGTSKEAWAKQAQKELKDKFDSLLKREIAAGVHIDAYLTADELDTQRAAELRQCQRQTPGWLNIPPIQFKNPDHTNTELRHALENGADGALIRLGDTLLSDQDLSKLISNLPFDTPTFFFETHVQAAEIAAFIFSNTKNTSKGGIAFDPVAHWMRTGQDYRAAITSITSLVNANSKSQRYWPIMVESHIYHNNGADAVQELAFTIAAAVTYIDLLTDAGISPAQAFNSLFYSVSIGTDYFTEIAKLRALRHLLRKITGSYGIPDRQNEPFILTRTSDFYHSEYAAYTNMIRVSSEAMSAVIGGCDALSVQGFETHLAEPSELSSRIARNVSSVLSFEAMLNTCADPAAGSYTIEKMSLALSDAAWELFLQIEDQRGLISCFESGWVQNQLQSALQEKLAALHSGKVMIGVNRFTEDAAEATQGYAGKINERRLLQDLRLASVFKTQSAAR